MEKARGRYEARCFVQVVEIKVRRNTWQEIYSENQYLYKLKYIVSK
jgi:hypothetical protein